jgi:hypothetical protein
MDTSEARISPDNGKANGNNAQHTTMTTWEPNMQMTATQTESPQNGAEKPINGIRAGTAPPNDSIPTFQSPVSAQRHKRNGKSNGFGGPSAVEQEADRPSPTRITTDFMVLPDGALVELVRGEKNELRLLIWKAGEASIVECYEHDGLLLTPPQVKEALDGPLKLYLPTGVEACPSARELFLDICGLIRDFVDLPESSIRIVAAFVLSTWFVGKLGVAPYLCIYGPPGSGKTTLLFLLHGLCRRGLLVAGSSPPAAIYSLPALLRPTLLLDELQFNGTQKSQTLECWLRAGNTRVPVGIGGQVVDAFGAKVLCSRQPVADTALASRALHISMVPTNNNLAPCSEELTEMIADRFQNRLQMFRLLHYREFEPRSYPDLYLYLSFTPRMRRLASALLLPFDDDKETRLAVAEALIEQNHHAQCERGLDPECQVIMALFWFCHQKGTSTALAGEIAEKINAIRKSLGEEADLRARKVGAILKAIGLATEGIGSIGRGLRLTTGVRRKIHELLKAYGKRPSDPTPAKCSFCADTFGGDAVGKASTAEKVNV